MTFKNVFKGFINNIVDKYNSIKLVNRQISEDFKELFQYNANSLDKLVYQNNGVVGLYDEMVDNGKTTFNKLYKIRTSINKLEDILFNRQNSADLSSNIPQSNIYHQSADAVLHSVKSNKPSRLKSVFISTIVGLGTMNYTYNNLRNVDDKSIPEDCKNYIYSPEKLSSIIELKNKYFWKTDFQLQDIVQKEIGVMVDSIESTIKEAMNLKINNPSYSNIARINYDSRIASQDMKQDFIRAYYSSDKTIRELAVDFEKKYGMHISASTISNNARKYLSSQGLDFKSRREAKKYYENKF